eukprot:1157922-Pelagomonas_calceolata.AAC.3
MHTEADFKLRKPECTLKLISSVGSMSIHECWVLLGEVALVWYRAADSDGAQQTDHRYARFV